LIDNIQKILWEDLLPYRELRKPLAYLLFQHLPPNFFFFFFLFLFV